MLNFLLLLIVWVIGVTTWSNRIRLWKYSLQLTLRQMQWALDLSSFDFWLIYRKGTLNPTDRLSCRPDYQWDAELEVSMTDNTSARQNMQFSTPATVISQLMSPTEERARQILVIYTCYLRSSNQWKQARGDVSNKSIYENVFKSLIDVLPEFLRADPLAKRVTQWSGSNSDLNIDLRDWTKLLYKRSVLYIPEVEALGWKSWRNTLMIPLLVTWLTRKRTILSATNISGPTYTNKWTRTVLPTWFVKELEWSLGRNQGSLILFLSPPRNAMFSSWTLLLGYHKVLHTKIRKL